jgi:lipopolysaccharide cholinephosphotransferase
LGVCELRELSITELRQVQLSLLDQFRSLCEAEGLRYFVGYGTLLGAVRHKGYIPWDDDVDILMPRADYDRLTVRLEAGDDGSSPVLLTPHSAGYPFPYSKFADRKTLLIEDTYLAVPIGVNLDIFPLDGWAPSRIGRAFQRVRISTAQLLLDAKSVRPSPLRSLPREMALRLGRFIASPVSATKMVQWMSGYAGKPAHRDSEFVGVLVGTTRERVRAALFRSPTFVSFEGRSLPAPQPYVEYLQEVYGDFEVPPPPDRQVTHHRFQAYWRDDD